MELYFLDTYALFELFKGNENYNKFERNLAIATTKLNLMEFYYTLLRIGTDNPDSYYERLLKFVVDISDDSIKKAMKFKLLHKSKELSYVDAIGYAVAAEKKAVFVTGDQQFKDMENVEYIK